MKNKKSIRLSQISPDAEAHSDGNKAEAQKKFSELKKQLVELQNMFYVDGRFPMLVMFQAMDTGGKDGAIRHVFEGVNPQGISVASFKKPDEKELRHDYLWRVHQEMPGKGKIVIFNRSHYEDVLVPRVHKLLPAAIINKRYDHIVKFEKMLTDEGMIILKFYLHISKDEQKKRLQERLDDPKKHWKFNPEDLKERKLWNAYQVAYETLLSKTSLPNAPWYVIPSNDKWYRDLIVTEIIVERMKRLKLKYPAPSWNPQKIKIS